VFGNPRSGDMQPVARRSRLVVVVALVGVLAALALGATTASGDTGLPVSTVPPIANGSPGVGKQLTTESGGWSTGVFTYQWVRCDGYFAGCTDIPGATAATYAVVADDVGHVLAARVTATNAAGSAAALSNGLGPVAALPPGLKHSPSIKGTKKVGQRVYATADRWTHSPDTFTIRWLRCSAAGNACVRITGKQPRCANGSCVRVNIGTQWDYNLTRKDAGHRLRVRVTAWNGAGHATSTSNPTRIVKK
jgi:hypothetical protein